MMTFITRREQAFPAQVIVIHSYFLPLFRNRLTRASAFCIPLPVSLCLAFSTPRYRNMISVPIGTGTTSPVASCLSLRPSGNNIFASWAAVRPPDAVPT